MDFSIFGEAIFDHVAVRIAFIIIVLYVVRLIADKFIGRIIERTIKGHRHKSKYEEQQREKTLTAMVKAATMTLLWIIAVLLILRELGVDIATLATGAGLIGIVIGFGAQSMIKDILSGMFIILENQYRIGDVVTIGGHSGLVEDITIRMTKLRDLDGSVYFVPNGEITTVQNMTLEYSGVVIDVGVSYKTDISEAEKIINQVGKDQADDPAWKDRIIEPVSFLRVESFGDMGVTLKVVGKTTPIEQWNVAGEYRKRLKEAFVRHKIDIPLPQRVVHEVKAK